jgi:hypothetical protein
MNAGSCGPRRLLALAAGLLACDQPEVPATSLLPAAYRQHFVTVRDCRPSIDHDLGRIVIKVDPGLAASYDKGPFPLPAGSLIVKEEFSDPGCTEPRGWTVMHKQEAGYDERYGNWRWQRLDAGGKVLEDGRLARCSSCHAASACRARDFTCAEP